MGRCVISIVAATDGAALAGLYAGGWDPSAEIRSTVADIVAAVRVEGDAALVAFTRRFDYGARSG